MKFYGVTTKFYDNGKVKSFMYNIEAERKPKSTFKETKICDAYNDFFETYEEAKEFVDDAYRA